MVDHDCAKNLGKALPEVASDDCLGAFMRAVMRVLRHFRRSRLGEEVTGRGIFIGEMGFKLPPRHLQIKACQSKTVSGRRAKASLRAILKVRRSR